MNLELRIKNKKKQIVKIFFASFVLFVLVMIHNSCLVIHVAQGATGVGMGIETSIKENEYNRAAMQLNQKASELDQRQAALNALQQQIARDNQRRDSILLFIGFILFSLIGVNYYLDINRRKLNLIKT